MKKIFVLFAFIPLVTFGQFSKGSKSIGGVILYNANEIGNIENQPPNTYFSIDSQFGFFLSESVVIGPVLGGYSNSVVNINPVTNLFVKSRYNGISAGFFARKFYKISDTFLFSIEGKAVAGNLSRTTLVFQEDTKGTRMLVAFRPVFSFVPSKRWYFDASIGEISYGVNWNTYVIDSKQFIANLGQVRFGVNYLFNNSETK